LGSVAPEPSKPLTKKEREKQDKGKQSVVDSHAQANATTNKFLFGGKSKNKYSWMTGGSSGGSGANTPGRIKTEGLSGTSGVTSGGASEKVMLTADGINKMGAHREDKKETGPLVEMRDLVAVLENDGKDVKTLQDIYAWLENPKSKRH
jgi:Transcription initiation factor TFIID component TAF4 family